MGQLLFISNPKKYKLDGQYNLHNRQLAQAQDQNQQYFYGHAYVNNQPNAEQIVRQEQVPLNPVVIDQQPENYNFMESIASHNSSRQEYWHSSILQSILNAQQDLEIGIDHKEMLADCFIVALQFGRFQLQMNQLQWIYQLNSILQSIQVQGLQYYAKLHMITQFINDFDTDFNELIKNYQSHQQQIIINDFPINYLFIFIESQQNYLENKQINPIEDLLEIFTLGVECGRNAQTHIYSGKDLIKTLLDLAQELTVLKNIVQYSNPPQNIRYIMSELLNELIQTRPSQLHLLLNRECPVCLEKIEYPNLIKIESCQHSFHKKCLGDYVDSSLQTSATQLKCPEVCNNVLTMTEIQLIFNKGKLESVQEKMNKQLFQQNPEVNQVYNQLFSTCPTANCDYAFIFEGEDNFQFLCPICLKSYCLKCRVQYHSNMTCQEYRQSDQCKRRLASQIRQDQQFRKFVKGQNYKQCPKCTIWVERISGCLHMTCHCKYEFCYRCGGKYGICPCGG